MFWLQCGACSGDSMSLLNLESPDLLELFSDLDLELLWHPSLSVGRHAREHDELLQSLASGERPLDILCVEGAVIRGPSGTGMYDTLRRRPKKDLVAALARRAGAVVAVGTCASYGGVCGGAEVEGTGLQFHRAESGGFLGAAFRARGGLPVVNLPGCPVHPEIVAASLSALVTGTPLELDEFQSPTFLYGMRVHQGCTRNEYHEYRVEERGFGERGCLFFYMGCQGPMARGACNRFLWNRRSSKTRVGVPCFACTRPDFPRAYPFFTTRAIEGLPLELPDGINRPHYLAYKTMAAAAAPERLKRRSSGV
ncbi:MAG: NADH:ubiquinone oxidoreductase [Polyangiaceae bacterium]|nr:NADH:ubiquinone oxidoreductase [Polyangiaceae bacterium]